MKKSWHIFALLLSLLFVALLSRAFLTIPARSPFSDRPPDSLLAEAVVTEGRTPKAAAYDLPTECVTMEEWNTMEPWMSDENYAPALLAELPEANAAFYGVGFDTVLIRWGNSLAEFDWLYTTPRCFPPQLWRLDIDGDFQDELIIDCYIDGGAGVSIEELHVLEMNADGTMTAFTFPEALWREQILETARTSYTGEGRGAVSFGPDAAEFSLEDVPAESLPSETDVQTLISTREVAQFTYENDVFRLRGAFAVNPETLGGLRYIADYSASISYEEGMFLLTDFHIIDF